MIAPMDIRTYRLAKGLTQAQFAELLAAYGPPAGQSHVSQWETGGMSITPDRATQIEAATGGEISKVDLIFGTPESRDA